MQAPEPNRLFFALSPVEAVRNRVAATADFLCTQHTRGGRRIKPDRYHITLFFLGNHVPGPVEAAALKAAARIEAPPFTLRLDQAGSFRNKLVPVWLGPSELPAELVFLEQLMRKTFAGLTQEQQPRFVPHLTILREAEKPLRKEPIEPIDWPVREFVLIRSILHKPPRHYERLRSYPLRGGPLPPEPKQFQLL